MATTTSATDPVAEAFLELLCRLPSDADRLELAHLATRPGRLRELLGGSHEHWHLVAPLIALARWRYQDWQFRQPTGAEICAAVQRTRHELGDDDGLRRALRDGSIRTRLAVRPINLEMDVTNQCNLRCVMCLFSTPEYRARTRQHMPVAVFERLADELFPVCHRVSLSYGTEPLLHADFIELIAILGRYHVPRTYVTTNGLLLTEALVRAMIEHGFHSLCVSIDAATAATYEKIRVGGSFERLHKNLRMLQQVKRAHGSDHPDLATAFVIRRDNMHELPDFVTMSHELGAIGVNAMHMIPFARLDNAADTAFHDQARCNAMLAAAQQRAHALGIQLVAPSPFPGVGPEAATAVDHAHHRFDLAVEPGWEQQRHCAFPWHFLAIDAHGNLLPCGWWYDERPLGNIKDAGIAELWRGPAFATLRAELERRQPRHNCSVCPAAGMGDPGNAAAFVARGGVER